MTLVTLELRTKLLVVRMPVPPKPGVSRFALHPCPAERAGRPGDWTAPMKAIDEVGSSIENRRSSKRGVGAAQPKYAAAGVGETAAARAVEDGIGDQACPCATKGCTMAVEIQTDQDQCRVGV